MREGEANQAYEIRLSRVFQFIEDNLDSNLSLEIVAQIAAFSPFHFHRIFKHITGETLNEYITRSRVEKAASTLINRRNISIKALSLQNGFTSNSSFTRTFKKFYGVSPTDFRKQNPYKFSKIRQVDSKNGQNFANHDQYICVINNLKQWIKMNATIEVKRIPKLQLAYMTCIGPQNLENTYQKLIKWATPKGLMNENTKMVTVYHDSFKVTQASKVRMNASIVVDKQIDFDGGIGLTSVGGSKYIIGNFEIGVHEFEKSWTGLFIWMNDNGYRKAEEHPFEMYHNNFNEHPEKKCIVDFYIPVE